MGGSRPSEDFEADDRSKRGDHLMTARLMRIVQGLQLIDPGGGIVFDVLPIKPSAKKLSGEKIGSRSERGASERLLLFNDVSAFEFPDGFNAVAPVFRLALVFENDKGEMEKSGFIIKSQSQKFQPEALLDFINNKIGGLKEPDLVVFSALFCVLACHPDARVRGAVQVEARRIQLNSQKDVFVSLAR